VGLIMAGQTLSRDDEKVHGVSLLPVTASQVRYWLAGFRGAQILENVG